MNNKDIIKLMELVDEAFASCLKEIAGTGAADIGAVNDALCGCSDLRAELIQKEKEKGAKREKEK